jgi:coatomer subunit beta'
VPEIVKMWKESLSKVNEKAAQALAEPTTYENLFPGYNESLKVESYLKETREENISASEYPNIIVKFIFHSF